MAEGDDQGKVRITARDLEEFLAGRSREDAKAVALRIAARSVPFIQTGDLRLAKPLLLGVFRALVVGYCDVDASLVNAAVRYNTKMAGRVIASGNTQVAHFVNAISFGSHVLADVAGNAARALDSVTRPLLPSTESLMMLGVKADVDFLVRMGDGHSTTLKEQSLWDQFVSTELPSNLRQFNQMLKNLGGDWPLLWVWYEQVLQDATIDPFPNKALDAIANEDPEFWGDGDDNPRTPDIVMADIADRLGWPHRVISLDAPVEAVADVAGTEEIDVVRTSNGGNLSSAGELEVARNSLADTIASKPNAVRLTVSGLLASCERERADIRAERPNHPKQQEEQKRKIEFFDKLISGLKEIQSSLDEDETQSTLQKIEAFLQDLENFYLRQPDFVQKSMRVTGVGVLGAGLVGLGASSAFAFPFVGCFFARKELGELGEFVKNTGKGILGKPSE